MMPAARTGPVVAWQPNRREPGQQRGGELDPIEIRRAVQQRAEQHRFDQLSVDLHPLDEQAERRPLQIGHAEPGNAE